MLSNDLGITRVGRGYRKRSVFVSAEGQRIPRALSSSRSRPFALERGSNHPDRTRPAPGPSVEESAVACNCGGTPRSTVTVYRLTLPNGVSRDYTTLQEAEAANRRAGGGGSISVEHR
ncbi:DUF7196 family protein [Streptomyces griseoluteus]